jgi:hypothetical protein
MAARFAGKTGIPSQPVKTFISPMLETSDSNPFPK